MTAERQPQVATVQAQEHYRQAEALIAQGRLDAAVPLLRQAEQAGSAAAGLRLAQYQLHFGEPGAAPEALACLARAREAGHPGAAYLSAWVAVSGHLMPQDTACMASWLLAAAQAGQADARRALILLQAWDGGQDDPADAHAPAPTEAEVASQLQAALRPPPVQTLAQDPWVAVADMALPPQACRLMCEAAAPRLRPSQVRDPLSGQAVQHPLRTSRDAALDPLEEDFALRLLQVRLAALAGLPLVHAEHLVLLHYQPGQEYRPHRDDLPDAALAANRPAAGQRLRTVCTYLNEVEDGGHTEFPQRGLRVAPQAGRALVFDNLGPDGSPAPASLHAGTPVRHGQKWLATLWFRQRPYRAC